MPLSEDDQRKLDQIEQALAKDDPRFAETVNIDRWRRRRIALAGASPPMSRDCGRSVAHRGGNHGRRRTTGRCAAVHAGCQGTPAAARGHVHRCFDPRPGVRTISPMSTTGRRIFTGTTMALAMMAIVFAVVALWHRHRPDARTAEHRSHSPLVRPSW